jgi:hypothetical protein
MVFEKLAAYSHQRIMDLRNRENQEELINSLRAIPSTRFGALADHISKLVAEEAKLDKEIVCLTSRVSEKEIKDHMPAVGDAPHISNLRLHVFDQRQKGTYGVDEYTLRLSGEMHESDMCFSDFVSRVDMKLNSGEIVSWNRSGDEKLDGIILTRPVSGGHQAVELSVHVNYRNCLYAVPTSLTKSSYVEHMTFVQLFKQIVGYIKSHHLSSNDDPSYFTPDNVLHDMLYPNHPRNHPVSFASLLEVIRNQFKLPGPFKFVHQLGQAEQIFDLMVHAPVPMSANEQMTLEESERRLNDKLIQIDREIGDLASGIDGIGKEATFLDRLANNPAEYLQEIINTPTGEVKNVESAGLIDYLQLATSYEFYSQPWAVAAAAHLVSEQRKEMAGNR